MDRQIIYPGQIPLETDLLYTNKNMMIGLSKLAAAILGTSTQVNGLACTPTGPASLQVNVAAGEIYQLANVDGTAYSSVAADTTHQILKQGILLDQSTLSCPAPGTVGFSINYLIQATFTETDGTPVVLPYYNASNPAVAYSGPANAGTTNNTVRKGVVTLAVKAGTAATTGTQTTPTADSGYVGLWVVTVANGQTQIIAGNIVQASGAPFLSSLYITLTSGDARYALKAGSSSQAFATAALTALGNGTFGNASAITSLKVNGINSGTGGGGYLGVQSGGADVIFMGNKSVLLGGAYDATPYIYAASAISTNVGMNFGGALTSNNGIAVPNLVLSTSQATTSGTSIDFTSIPSWVKKISIMFNGVSTSGTSPIIVQIGNAGVDTSGYLGSTQTTSSAINATTGFGIEQSRAAVSVIGGRADLNLIGSNVWTFSAMTGRSDSAAMNWGGGNKTLAAALTNLRITTAGGTDTFDAGSVNIIYEG